MKTKLLLALLLCSLSVPCLLNAQIRFNVNVGAQPIWGPVGYDKVDNYYLPEIESYYNVNSKQYTYMNNGQWVTTPNLPSRYSNYDLYRGYKVVINEPKPYLHFNDHRVKYISYGNKHDQQVIRDSKEEKYYENENHPMHKKWKNKAGGYGNNGNGNNNGKGYGNGKGNNSENGKGKGYGKGKKSENEDEDDDDENGKGYGKGKNSENEKVKEKEKENRKGNGKGKKEN